MTFIVTIADIESRWRALSPVEAEVATVLIEDLLNQLSLIRPDSIVFINELESSTTPESSVTATALRRVITGVIANAVRRVLRNPDSLRSVSIGADGSIGVGYDNDPLALAKAELTANDLREIDSAIASAGGASIQRVRSVELRATYPKRPLGDITRLPLP